MQFKDAPFNDPKTPKFCPNGKEWNRFGYNTTQGHFGFICDDGDHVLNFDGTRDEEREAILTQHYNNYHKATEGYQRMIDKSVNREGLTVMLAPIKKERIDESWLACYDLLQLRKNGPVRERPDEVEKIQPLWDRYKLEYISRFDWVRFHMDPSEGKVVLSDESAAEINRILELYSHQWYEILGLDPAREASITKVDITDAFNKQSMLVDPVTNGHMQAEVAQDMVINAKRQLLLRTEI